MIPWQHDVDLAPMTTFGVPATARHFVRADNAAMAIAAWQEAQRRGLPVLVLGGGSNILFTRDFDGLVLAMAMRGMRYASVGDTILVTVAAGEPWHGLVQHTLSQQVFGLENLSLIPGTVGAAPIQNIGAYGVELKDVFAELRAWDQVKQEFRRFSAAECRFGYRDSLFKQQAGRYLIVEVVLRLSLLPELQLDYGDIRQQLQVQGIDKPTPQDVSAAVIAIRSRKLPDPARWGNAGSFFKNPLVSPSVALSLRQQHAHMPQWPQAGGRVKLAAGWLIEQCGWRGRSLGAAAVYEHQALVLVNRGGARGSEIQQLAQQVQNDVQQRFGVLLEPEPLVL